MMTESIGDQRWSRRCKHKGRERGEGMRVLQKLCGGDVYYSPDKTSVPSPDTKPVFSSLRAMAGALELMSIPVSVPTMSTTVDTKIILILS